MIAAAKIQEDDNEQSHGQKPKDYVGDKPLGPEASEGSKCSFAMAKPFAAVGMVLTIEHKRSSRVMEIYSRRRA